METTKTFSKEEFDVSSLVDCKRYPIDKPESEEYKKLVHQCQQQMKEDGSCTLSGFLREDKIAHMRDEVSNLPTYHRHEFSRAYHYEDESITDASHPLNRSHAQSVFAVAADMVPQNAGIQYVYRSEMVINFFSDVLNTALYLFGDEFQNLNIMYIKDGGNRAWHYDGSDFVITLLLQSAETGGEFEYAPFIRGQPKTDEKFEDVRRVMDGDKTGMKLFKAHSGTLAFFNGLRSLHRVRTVYGPMTRIQSVLSYDTKPNQVSWKENNIRLYGERVAKIYKEREKAAESQSVNKKTKFNDLNPRD